MSLIRKRGSYWPSPDKFGAKGLAPSPLRLGRRLRGCIRASPNWLLWGCSCPTIAKFSCSRPAQAQTAATVCAQVGLVTTSCTLSARQPPRTGSRSQLCHYQQVPGSTAGAGSLPIACYGTRLGHRCGRSRPRCRGSHGLMEARTSVSVGRRISQYPLQIQKKRSQSYLPSIQRCPAPEQQRAFLRPPT
jgi:hypothetical protein